MAMLSVKNILILSFLSQVGPNDITALHQLSYYKLLRTVNCVFQNELSSTEPTINIAT